MSHKTILIGVSGRGLTLARTISAHPHFELAGVADIDPQRLQDAAGKFSVPQQGLFTDYQQAVDSGLFDVAVIALPNNLHYPATRDVLNASMHCLTEKPFTLEMSHAQELVSLADEKKLVLQVVQNYRTTPPLPTVRQAITEQRLGGLIGVEGSFHRNRQPRAEHEQQLPCSVLFIQGIHHLDWLRSALPSPITGTFARFASPPVSDWQCPSICHVILQCQDGTLVNFRASYDSQGQMSRYCGRWRFEFEKGDLIIDDNQDLWQITEQGRQRNLLEKFTGEADNAAPLFDALHKAITEGLEPPTSGRDNLKTLKLILDIVNSANSD